MIGSAKIEGAAACFAAATMRFAVGLAAAAWGAACAAEEPKLHPGAGPGWRTLGPDDFEPVNCPPQTFVWTGDTVRISGQPTGVLRTKRDLQDLEIVVEWRHLRPGGNSGLFLWATLDGMAGLKPGRLPSVGIEIQVLDLAFKHQMAARGARTDWFTCHGDVFPVGRSRMKPFPPLSPDGSRSFPKQERSKPSPQWNHYHVVARGGEVRLAVNGVEVSGGAECRPARGRLCLESEGAPVEFKGLRIREFEAGVPAAAPAAPGK